MCAVHVLDSFGAMCVLVFVPAHWCIFSNLLKTNPLSVLFTSYFSPPWKLVPGKILLALPEWMLAKKPTKKHNCVHIRLINMHLLKQVMNKKWRSNPMLKYRVSKTTREFTHSAVFMWLLYPCRCRGSLYTCAIRAVGEGSHLCENDRPDDSHEDKIHFHLRGFHFPFCPFVCEMEGC